MLTRDNLTHTGLDTATASARLQAEGPNVMDTRGQQSLLALLAIQFKSSVVILLVVAAVISAVMHDELQMLGIVAAIFINAAIGFLTDWRSQVSLRELDKFTAPTVSVLRSGVEQSIPAGELVRGDVVILQPGDRVPADLRLLEDASLSVDESLLTGESLPVAKSGQSEKLEDTVLFHGTTINSGRAIGEVIATGKRTRLGKLGRSIAAIQRRQTPLETELERLGQNLTWLTIAVCIFTGIVGFFQHQNVLLVVETSIALAVAAIPEGLPVVSTIALAVGVRQMVKQRALVRRLPAVETLGCTTVICTDKTGTLTENKLRVVRCVTADCTCTITGLGYEPTGEFYCEHDKHESKAEIKTSVEPLLLCAALCNDARLESHDELGWHVHGDPTEGALLVAARKVGFNETSLRNVYPRVAELPFDLHRKRMSTMHSAPGGAVMLFCKGSPETVLPLCTTVLKGESAVELTDEMREWFRRQNNELSGQGLRVLAVARREFSAAPVCIEPEVDEQQLTLLGLVGMLDPVKPGVVPAVRACSKAGIDVYMLTGDQPQTALAIARELGISTEGGAVTGRDFEMLTKQQMADKLQTTHVLARVTPELKLSMVQDLQADNEVVAMTGDGVNDAPALAQSDVGVAMGGSGAALARDCASLVITDDRFETIVAAIAQGRAVFQKIQSAIGYLLTASVASVAAVAFGLFVHEGLLLLPLQLLWLNLMMHVFPGLGLVIHSGVGDVMARKPRKRNEHLLSKREWYTITINAVLIAIGSLVALVVDTRYFGGGATTTLALAALGVSIVMQSWVWFFRSNLPAGKDGAIAYQGFSVRTVLPLIGCDLISIGLLIAAIYWRPLQVVLRTGSLTGQQWLIVLATAASTFVLGVLIAITLDRWQNRR